MAKKPASRTTRAKAKKVEDNEEIHEETALDLSTDEEVESDEEGGASGDEGSEGEDEEEFEYESDGEITAAISKYASALKEHGDDAKNAGDKAGADKSKGRRGGEAVGGDGVTQEERDFYDDAADSSEDERDDPKNTVGRVPLEWYKHEDHIGYDREGNKIEKQAQRDTLDDLLAKVDNPDEWRTVRDEYNDEDVVLSNEEVRMIQRMRKGQYPHAEVDPYPEYQDWMVHEDAIHPLNNAPEPKRRFIPSKWEAKKVVKLIRAIRRGWIKLGEDKEPEKPKVYLLWEDDNMVSDKTANGLTYIPPPKPDLPGHAESYNPSLEYLPTEEERAAFEVMDDEDKPDFVPTKFDGLRKVPAYDRFINERFERCLDLYLCPRVRKKKLNIDPESLVPKLPKPRDLEPYPNMVSLRFEGHEGKVRSVSCDPTGQWVASGADDGCVKVWEVRTGRCFATWDLGEPVRCVAWCPNKDHAVVAAAAGSKLALLPTDVYGEGAMEAAEALLSPPAESAGEDAGFCSWGARAGAGGGLELSHKHAVHHVSWHARGDYFCSVSPHAHSTAVLVHQLSKHSSQNPFRKNRGRVRRALFHPTKPFFFVATQNYVRVYNLAKQALAKKLMCGSGQVTSMAIHPGGDNVIIGSDDKRVVWFDMDLSTKPYKVLRHHDASAKCVAYHPRYPLFASGSDDGTVHVFHGMVYSDLLQNPLLVPVKVLRGQKVVDYEGVLDVAFHPTQPWLFAAGADGSVVLYYNC